MPDATLYAKTGEPPALAPALPASNPAVSGAAIRFGQADLTTCDQEPIHLPGSIQPHGILLVVNRHDLVIVQYAGDTRLLLGIEPQRMAGCTLPDLFEQPMLAALIGHVQAPAPSAEPVILQDLTTHSGQLTLTATFHAQGELAVLELEPARSSRTASGDPLAHMKSMLAALQAAPGLEACCQSAAVQVRALIGFSRVMVYQFLHDGSGKVVAEDRAKGLDSFLDLHYPASDIPQQARALYQRSWLRLIPDVDYTPLPLQPASIAGAALDMSHCALRSVSPLHLEYLRNMGVRASMSLSIMIGERLWGLIACHNDSPRYIAADLRLACELFAQLFSLQLDARIERATAQRRLVHKAVQAALASSLPMAQDIATELVSGPVTVLDLIPAGGVAIWLGGQLHTLGQTPAPDAIGELVLWLNSIGQPVVDTFQLRVLFPPALAWPGTACGLLAISLSRSPEDYVIWFRPEVVRSVTWAGNPEKPVEAAEHGLRLTPRKSFAAWKTEVRQQCAPWDLIDLEAAHAFRLWLLETVLRQVADLARQEREAAFVRQSMLMAELDHRVKNTLANIQALLRHTKLGADSLEDFALGLEMRIRAMARAHDLLRATHRDGACLRQLVEEELAPFCTQNKSSHRIDGPALLLASRAALPFTMVMHELVSNAAKYGALSTPAGWIEMNWHQQADDGALLLRWKEHDGPPVTPPTRRGFGSVVIERSLRHELQGSGSLAFEADGVSCTITIPAHYLGLDAEPES